MQDGDGAESGLAGLSGVAVSPDRRFVYGASAGDDAVTVFARDPDGNLAFVQSITGLGDVSTVTVSPDALHVYAALSTADGIGVWSRSSSGQLVSVERNRTAGLDGVRGLAVSPDGRHLYAAAVDGNRLLAFARDPIRGRLSFLEAIDDLPGAAAVAVAPEGTHVYVANFADDSLAAFRRDPTSGRLTGLGLYRDGVGGVDGLAAVSALAVSPDGELVYAAGSDAMAVFERDAGSGALSFRESKRYFTPTVLCPLGPTAAVSIGPDHRHVYVARALDAAVADFERDPNSGALVLRDTYEDASPGRGCDGSLSFAPAAEAGMQQLYASGLAEDRLTVLAADDALQFQAEHRNGAGGIEGLAGASALAVSSDDRHVYAAGAAGGLAAFARSAEDGTLRFIDAYRDGIDGVVGLGGVSTLGMDPEGRNVYFATSGDVLGVFARDGESGRLSFQQQLRNGVDGVTGLAGTSRLRSSGDGRHLYVASQGDNAVSVFARDTGDGRLGFIEEKREDVDGVDGIVEASAVALSPNGAHVYVTGAPGTLALFARDEASGRLTWLASYRNRSGGIDGLAGAVAVEVSADGAHVYVAGSLDAAIAIFSRDAATGRLGFLGVVRDAGGRLAGLRDLTLDGFGSRLYAVTQPGGLATYERRAGLGTLRLLRFLWDGVDGVDGLGGASAVLTSGDARSIYATGATDAALAAFAAAE